MSEKDKKRLVKALETAILSVEKLKDNAESEMAKMEALYQKLMDYETSCTPPLTPEDEFENGRREGWQEVIKILHKEAKRQSDKDDPWPLAETLSDLKREFKKRFGEEGEKT